MFKIHITYNFRISTLVSGKNTITKTANRLTGTFIYVVIVNIIYNIKKGEKKNSS